MGLLQGEAKADGDPVGRANNNRAEGRSVAQEPSLQLGGVHGMIAVKLKGMVTRDHRLEHTLPPSVPPGEVEVMVLHPESPPRPRVRWRQQPLTGHPAAGWWADHEDIGDTVTFVSQLRHRLETRHDGHQ